MLSSAKRGQGYCNTQTTRLDIPQWPSSQSTTNITITTTTNTTNITTSFTTTTTTNTITATGTNTTYTPNTYSTKGCPKKCNNRFFVKRGLPIKKSHKMDPPQNPIKIFRKKLKIRFFVENKHKMAKKNSPKKDQIQKMAFSIFMLLV